MNKHEVLSLQERFGIAHDCFREQPYHQMIGGWKRVISTKDISDHYQLSGLYAALYSRETQEPSGTATQFAIGFRGYDEPEDFDDILCIGMDLLPGQIADGYHFARVVIEKYGIEPSKLECVGHSLGGYLSKAVGLMLQSEKIYAFNSPRLDKNTLPMLSALRRAFIENVCDVSEDEINQTVLTVISSEDNIPQLGDFAGREIAVRTIDYHHRLPSLEEAIIRAFIAVDEQKDHPRAVPGKFLSAWKHLLKIVS